MVLAIAGAAAPRPAAGLDPARDIAQYAQRRWSLEQGLPQVSANAIVQDAQGYLWVGTYGGLVRFDGAEVEPVDSEGRCSDRILALRPDPDGGLWIGTERSGLCVLRHGEVAPVEAPDGKEIGGVAAIEVAPRGRVRAATAHGLIELGGGEPFRRTTPADGLPHENALAVSTDAAGAVWVGTRQGLCILRGRRCEVPTWAAPLAGALVEAIHHSADGSSWVGSKAGLYRVRHGVAERISMPVPGGRIRAILEDREGSLWIGLDPGGLLRVRPRVETLTQVDRHTGDVVTSLLEDGEGNLWVGTRGDGLLELVDGAATGLLLRFEGAAVPVLPVVAEGGGHAWVGTICRGLARIGPQGTELLGPREGLANACVWSLLKDRQGVLWIGSHGDGLYWRDPDGTIGRAGGPRTPENVVRALAEEANGAVLVGTDAGVFRFDRQRRELRPLAETAGLDVFFIDVDEAGAIFLGTLQGLRILGPGGMRTIGKAQGLTSDFVRAVHRDADGVLWIGTYGGGLARVAGDRVFVFGRQQGLPDTAVSRILEDGRGRFWLSGNRGVTRVARAELEAVARGELETVLAEQFDVFDGMPATETNGGGQPAGALDRDGKVWIPTVSGLAVFDARAGQRSRRPPPVYVKRILVGGREIARPAARLELPASARDLEIHYTALSFRAPERVRFRYRLEGFDRRWVEAGSRRVAYYPYIPAGRLRFRVVAADAEGVWNETGDGFELVMAPPFFQTWWFYGLAVVSLGLIYGLASRARAASAARRERVLEAEVAERTAELARLAKLTEIMNEAVSLEEVLDHVYEDLGTLIPYDRLGLALLDEDRIVLRAVWSRGRVEPAGIARGYEAPLAGSSLERILETGEPRIIADLERYVLEHPDSESARRIVSEGVRSNLTFPLRARGRPVGFVFFSSFQPDTYGETHVALLRQIAGHLSLIVDKSRLYEDLLATKSRLEEANRDLERLAHVDGLTGLANRRAFDERLLAEWRRAGRGEQPLSLLLVDVDFFKAFNDGYGHLAGDECLRTLAAMLTRCARRAGDLVARFGGEEFALILPDCAREEALAMAEKLRGALAELAIAHRYSGVSSTVTISVGVATTQPDAASSPHRLVELADRALYEAKRAGRDRTVFRGEPAA